MKSLDESVNSSIPVQRDNPVTWLSRLSMNVKKMLAVILQFGTFGVASDVESKCHQSIDSAVRVSR